MSLSYLNTTKCRNRIGADRFDNLYRLPAESAELDQDMIQAETYVDGLVGKRYSLPVADARAVVFLTALTLDIFEEFAWGRGGGSDLPEKIKRKADAARKTLEMIAKGTMTLAGAQGLQEPEQQAGDAIIVEGDSVEFSRPQLGGF